MPLTLTIRAGDARRLFLPVLPHTDPTPDIPCLGRFRVRADATWVPSMNPLNLNDPDDIIATLAAAAETTTDADLREAYQYAGRAVYAKSHWWRPDDHPLFAALARHAHRHRGHPQPGGLTHTQEDT